MKIAIYGDSYAHCISPRPDINNDGSPWFNLVKNAGFDITNYAQSGSSFYYSYIQFKKNYINYDKNIFLGTFPGRRYISLNGTMIHAQTWHTRPEFKNDKIRGGKMHEALSLYYGYLYNEEEDTDYIQLMENYILSKKNVLYLNIQKTLYQLFLRDKANFNIKDNEDINENMHCHLTNENNKILADSIIEWLQTGNFEFDINMYPTPNINLRGKYWPK
jgi:hypothetical protein